jgi:hypothetical protein
MNETFFLEVISFEVDKNTNLVNKIKWHFNYTNSTTNVDIYNILEQFDPPIQGLGLTIEDINNLLPNYIDIDQLKKYSLSDMSGVI